MPEMSASLAFRDVVEAADHLSHEEQQELVDIVQRRLALAARQRIAGEVAEARTEFAAGQCAVATPADIVSEIVK